MEGSVAVDVIQEGMARYEAKAPLTEVIDLFEKGLEGDKSQRNTAQTCLSWLYCLTGENEKAIKTAKEAIRTDRSNAQAHFNLVLAMIASGKKGVREELQRAYNVATHDGIHEAQANLQDALERQPDFTAATKLLGWLAHDD